MRFLFVRIVFCALFFTTANSYVLPVTKCSFEDSKCLLSSFQKGVPIFFSGIPELGIEKMEAIDDVKFDIAGLKFSFKNGRATGFKKIIIDDVSFNNKTKRIHIIYHTNSTIMGDYKASGKIFFLPINGDGKMDVKLKNIAIDVYIDYEIVKLADGKDHLRLLNYNFEFEVKDHARYHLTNLFKGNQKLSEDVLMVINNLWKDVSKEFGRPLIERTAEKVFKNVNIFLEKMPLEDIAIV